MYFFFRLNVLESTFFDMIMDTTFRVTKVVADHGFEFSGV